MGRGPIHRDDNFFALGGHSLLAIAVAHRLEQAVEKQIAGKRGERVAQHVAEAEPEEKNCCLMQRNSNLYIGCEGY